MTWALKLLYRNPLKPECYILGTWIEGHLFLAQYFFCVGLELLSESNESLPLKGFSLGFRD